MIQISTANALILFLTVVLQCIVLFGVFLTYKWAKEKGHFVDFKTWHIARHKMLLSALQELMNDYQRENNLKSLSESPVKALYTWAQLRTIENDSTDHQTVTLRGK